MVLCGSNKGPGLGFSTIIRFPIFQSTHRSSPKDFASFRAMFGNLVRVVHKKNSKTKLDQNHLRLWFSVFF